MGLGGERMGRGVSFTVGWSNAAVALETGGTSLAVFCQLLGRLLPFPLGVRLSNAASQSRSVAAACISDHLSQREIERVARRVC